MEHLRSSSTVSKLTLPSFFQKLARILCASLQRKLGKQPQVVANERLAKCGTAAPKKGSERTTAGERPYNLIEQSVRHLV